MKLKSKLKGGIAFIPVVVFEWFHHAVEWWHFKVSQGVLRWTRKTSNRIWDWLGTLD